MTSSTSRLPAGAVGTESTDLFATLPQELHDSVCRRLPLQSLGCLASASKSLHGRTISYANSDIYADIRRFIQSLAEHLPDCPGKSHLLNLLKGVSVGGHEWPLRLIKADVHALKNEIINVLTELGESEVNRLNKLVVTPAVFSDIYDIVYVWLDLRNALAKFHMDSAFRARRWHIERGVSELIQYGAFNQAIRSARAAAVLNEFYGARPNQYMGDLARACLDIGAIPEALQLIPSMILGQDRDFLSLRVLDNAMKNEERRDDETWVQIIEIARSIQIKVCGYLSKLAQRFARESRFDLALLSIEAINERAVRWNLLNLMLKEIQECCSLDPDQKALALEKTKAALQSIRYDQIIEDVPCDTCVIQ